MAHRVDCDVGEQLALAQVEATQASARHCAGIPWEGIRYIAIAHSFARAFARVRHRRGGSLTCYCLHGCIVDTRASGDGQPSQVRQPRRERGQASTTNTSTALCVNRRMVAATERRRLPRRDARPHLEVQFAQLWRRNRDVPAGVISK